MKGPKDRSNQFGIYRLDAWTKNYKIMLKSKMDMNKCLIVANGRYGGDSEHELQLMDCV